MVSMNILLEIGKQCMECNSVVSRDSQDGELTFGRQIWRWLLSANNERFITLLTCVSQSGAFQISSQQETESSFIYSRPL